MQHHKFECVTHMFFNPSDTKEAAGMLLFKDERHQYFFCVSQPEDGRSISLKKIDGTAGGEVIESCKIDANAKEVYLKVVSKETSYDFYYSLESDDEWTLLCGDVDAGYLSTAVAGGFTGSMIGMYATRK